MSNVGLHQTTSQQQVLAPQMRQSLEVLQVTSTELQQIANQALEVNPTLEFESSDQSIEDLSPRESLEADEVKPTEDDWREDYIMSSGASESTSGSESTRDFLYNSIVAPQTLQKHLSDQLLASGLSEDLKSIGFYLIGAINDQGLFDQSISTLAEQIGCNIDEAIDVQSTLQTFTPDGVACESIQESLLLQLEKQNKVNSLEYQIVSECLDLLAKKKTAEVARKLKQKVDLVEIAVRNIKKLNPHPGLEFSASGQMLVQADLIAEKNSEGEVEITLTNANIPSLKISEEYKSLLPTLTQDAKAKTFLKNNIRDGRLLIKAIAQRQETILKITQEILRSQDRFLEEGVASLKPMNMNEIAEKIEVHPTTVSRAVAGKYLQTKQGLIELRAFFSTGYQTEDGASISNAGVKDTIAKLIANEPKNKPLSDSAIEKKLAETGLKVARRTVAKYREQLGILPSYLRKGV